MPRKKHDWQAYKLEYFESAYDETKAWIIEVKKMDWSSYIGKKTLGWSKEKEAAKNKGVEKAKEGLIDMYARLKKKRVLTAITTANNIIQKMGKRVYDDTEEKMSYSELDVFMKNMRLELEEMTDNVGVSENPKGLLGESIMQDEPLDKHPPKN